MVAMARITLSTACQRGTTVIPTRGALRAEGMTNRQIGERVHLAEKTIKTYVSNILMKLGLQRRAEVAALMVKRRRGGDAQRWS